MLLTLKLLELLATLVATLLMLLLLLVLELLISFLALVVVGSFQVSWVNLTKSSQSLCLEFIVNSAADIVSSLILTTILQVETETTHTFFTLLLQGFFGLNTESLSTSLLLLCVEFRQINTKARCTLQFLALFLL